MPKITVLTDLPRICQAQPGDRSNSNWFGAVQPFRPYFRASYGKIMLAAPVWFNRLKLEPFLALPNRPADAAFGRRLTCYFRVEIAAGLAALDQSRVVPAQIRENRRIRDVGEGAAVVQVLHVPAPGRVEGMEQ